MCGIAGVWCYDGARRLEEPVLSRMRDSMTHRGPDGSGLWLSADGMVGLVHRRLSIVDLSESAAQPMSNEDGAIRITFNGEIYNHAPLRTELQAAGHRFRTHHSDTEVLVHGYEQWGVEGLLSRIEGDYAFGIWDARQSKLTIARDRIGVKPVYFALVRGCLFFASEIKAILAHPAVEADIEPIAMYHYLSFLTTPAPLTMFRGIYKLPAGCWMQISSDGTLDWKRYWDATPGQGIDQARLTGLSDVEREKFYVDGIRSRLVRSIEKRMMSNVPFGVFLSGGIDSSTNVALMSRLMDRPVDTFTVGFKDHTHLNELEYASRVAKEFKTQHHEILIGQEDMVGYLSDLIHHQDEPIADWVCIPLYFVSKLAKDNGVTVIQVGEGADEQFSGYASYLGYLRLYHRYWRPFRAALPSVLQRAIASLAKGASRGSPRFNVYADILDRAARGREHFWSGATVFWDTLKQRLISTSALERPDIPRQLLDSGLLPATYLEADTFNIIQSFQAPFDAAHPRADTLTRMIHNEFRLRLPELLLMRVDKITMSTSLEARVPFLDHELVEFSMDIPEAWKVRNGQAKYILKKAVEGIIPHDIIYRKKMGFGAPMSQWLRGSFGRAAERRIRESNLMSRGYFRMDYIESLFAAHRSGQSDTSLYIWTLFNLCAWYDYWIEGEDRASLAA